MIVLLIVLLIANGSQEHHVAHRFFVGELADLKCETWSELYLKKVEERNKTRADYNINPKVGAATCIDTGLTILNAPWIRDDTAGLTPGLPGEPSF